MSLSVSTLSRLRELKKLREITLNGFDFTEHQYKLLRDISTIKSIKLSNCDDQFRMRQEQFANLMKSGIQVSYCNTIIDWNIYIREKQ